MRLCNLFGIWVFCFHSLQLEYDSVETSHQTQTLLFTTEQKAVSWFHAWITTQFTVDLHWGAKQRPLIDTYSKGCRERITWNHIWIHLSKSSTAGIRVERLQVWVQCFLSESISAVIVKRRQNIYVFCFVHSDHKLLFYEYLHHGTLLPRNLWCALSSSIVSFLNTTGGWQSPIFYTWGFKSFDLRPHKMKNETKCYSQYFSNNIGWNIHNYV